MVIPTQDRSGLLTLALRSVLWQRDVEFEVIVVDDGSADDTSEVVAGLGDPRVRLIRHDVSQGVSAARNRGIAEARGKWIAFLDDDDLWAPDKLSSQLLAAVSSARAWVYVGAVNISTSHRVVGGSRPLSPEEIPARLRESNVVPGGCSGVMVARAALEAAGSFDRALRPLADWDLWLRLAAGGSPAWVPRPLVAYRVHAQNLSLDAKTVERDFLLVSRRYGIGNRAILYRYLGWWSHRGKRRARAIRYFVRGLLQRDEHYRFDEFAQDIVYVCRSTLESVFARLDLAAVGRARSRGSGEQEQDDWRADGQRWVDDLLDTTIGDVNHRTEGR